MLIVYFSTKGGTGKTTIAVCHADWLLRRGYSIGFLDADRQKHSSEWLGNVHPQVDIRKAAEPGQVNKKLNSLLAEHNVVVADGPGGSDRQNIVLVKRADICVIPALPSPLDIHSAYTGARELLRVVEKRHGGERIVRFVLNGVDDRTGIAKKVRSFARRMEPPAAKTVVRYRTDITNSYPTRMPNNRDAKHDLNALFTELTSLWDSQTSLRASND